MHSLLTISSLCREGLLTEDPARRQGREKAYVLTAAGADYSAKHLSSLNAIEDRAGALPAGGKAVAGCCILSTKIGLCGPQDNLHRFVV